MVARSDSEVDVELEDEDASIVKGGSMNVWGRMMKDESRRSKPATICFWSTLALLGKL